MNSVSASTTNNYSGIYDMSGGAWEYVMGVMDKDGVPCSGRNEQNHSGFNGPYCNTTGEKTDGIDFPIHSESRYYDVYEYATVEKYSRRILGDATGETGPFAMKQYGTQSNRQVSSWYDDESWFVHSWGPWFIRGSDFSRGMESGMFSFSNAPGATSANVGFRIVLSI